jgi:3-deoxy-D-manno-octulosonate 8-phosphate phosphatase (KDO 8-P phosphatase)
LKKLKNLKNIKALLIDVDGIMTDGTLWSHSPGEWRRTFNIYDGVGIRALIKEGYTVGIITGSDSNDIRERQKKLGILHLYEGVEDKIPSYEDFVKKTTHKESEIAYIGDDLADIPILKRVGFSVSVPTGMLLAKKAASYITKKEGGKGAVREVCDMILASKIKTKGKK